MRNRSFQHREPDWSVHPHLQAVLDLAARPDGCSLTDVVLSGLNRTASQALLHHLEDTQVLRAVYDPRGRHKVYRLQPH